MILDFESFNETIKTLKDVPKKQKKHIFFLRWPRKNIFLFSSISLTDWLLCTTYSLVDMNFVNDYKLECVDFFHAMK